MRKTYVHSNTTDTRPAVALGLVLVVRGTGLEQRLVNATATSDQANSGAANGKQAESVQFRGGRVENRFACEKACLGTIFGN